MPAEEADKKERLTAKNPARRRSQSKGGFKTRPYNFVFYAFFAVRIRFPMAFRSLAT